MEKAIFISADCWLAVFHLLPPSKLGLQIAMISHRFDRRVDEHFKTRKWTLKKKISIKEKIGVNGAKKMKIVNDKGKALPIPKKPLPNKFIGFGSIYIHFFNQNVLTFLRRFHRFFASCATQLFFGTENARILAFIVRNIWPVLKDTICEMYLTAVNLCQISQLAPSMLTDCPALRFVAFDGGISFEFPPAADGSANASEDGQVVAKWLFSPRHDNLMKNLNIENSTVEQWLTNVEHIKAPVAFIIFIDFPPSSSIDSVVPFKLTNQLTGEQLKMALSQTNANGFMLLRCPIAEGSEKKLEKAIEGFFMPIRRNKIDIFIGEDGVHEGLLDGSPGPNGQQQ